MDNRTHNSLVDYSAQFIGKCVPGSKEYRSAGILWKLVEEAYQYGIEEGQTRHAIHIQNTRQDPDERKRAAEARRRDQSRWISGLREQLQLQAARAVDRDAEEKARKRNKRTA